MSSALAAILAIQLATATDGGLHEVDEVQTGSLVLVDGTHKDVSGGGYLPPETLLAAGKELAQLRAEKAAHDAEPNTAAAPLPVVVAIACFLAGGLVGAGLVIVSKH